MRGNENGGGGGTTYEFTMLLVHVTTLGTNFFLSHSQFTVDLSGLLTICNKWCNLCVFVCVFG